MIFLLIIVYLCYGGSSAHIPKPDTTTVTLNGRVRGRVLKTVTNRDFIGFEGIPYAKPPVGENRFKEPEPIEDWSGIWEATKLHKCLQYNHYGAQSNNGVATIDNVVQGDEDCLYLNIYTPKLNSTKKYNVIVYIHGGWFTYGSGGAYGPEILLDREVVYVTFNYRLGPLGFLSTEDEVLPGNLGMKDQVLALQWIKNNIENFSGNHDSITITGLSAGGASVHLHLISPLSKGTFTRGISQSGHAFDSWILTKGSLEKTKLIACSLGCPTFSSEIMIECLKTRPAKDIVYTVKLLKPWVDNPVAPLGVVVDNNSKRPFLPQHPYVLIQKGLINDVPWLLSHTSAEGLDPAADFMANPSCLDNMETRWNEIIPYILHYNYTVEPEHFDKVSKKIKEHYFKDKPVSAETFPQVVQLFGDRLFVTESGTVARLHASVAKSPVFYYYFTYRGAHSMSELGAQNNNNYGSSHGDDTITIVSTRFQSLTTDSDRHMSKIMVDLWMSFSKMGEPYIPDVHWTPVSKNPNDLIHYVQINSPDDISMKTAENFGEYDFWKSLKLNELDAVCDTKDEL